MGELTTSTGQGHAGIVPAYHNIMETISACREIGKSLAATYQLKSPFHGEVMMLTCLSEGLSVSNYHKRYHPDGTMRASAIQAEFIRRGGKIKWENFGDDHKEASAYFSHPSLMPEPVLIKYTINDARLQVGDKMTKDGSNWKTNPGAMLRAALVRKAVKIIDPGVISGYDEFSEFEESAQSRSEDVAAAAAAAAERHEELMKSMNEEIVDVKVTVVDSTNVDKPEPEPETAKTPEAAPAAGDTPTAAEDSRRDSEELCTPEQLKTLLEYGKKFPSEEKPGERMGLKEIGTKLCNAAGVKTPREMTFLQAKTMIERMKTELEK